MSDDTTPPGPDALDDLVEGGLCSCAACEPKPVDGCNCGMCRGLRESREASDIRSGPEVLRQMLGLTRQAGGNLDSVLFSAFPQRIFKPRGLIIWDAPSDALVSVAYIGCQAQIICSSDPVPARWFAMGDSYEQIAAMLDEGKEPPGWVTWDPVLLGNQVRVTLDRGLHYAARREGNGDPLKRRSFFGALAAAPAVDGSVLTRVGIVPEASAVERLILPFVNALDYINPGEALDFIALPQRPVRLVRLLVHTPPDANGDLMLEDFTIAFPAYAPPGIRGPRWPMQLFSQGVGLMIGTGVVVPGQVTARVRNTGDKVHRFSAALIGEPVKEADQCD